MPNQFVQAYQQTPWRFEVKWVGRFLLAMIIAAMIAGLYLSISAQVAEVSIDILRLENEKEAIQYSTASLKTQLALLTSAIEMEKRAEAMNFEPMPVDKAVYVQVPGFSYPQAVNLAPPPGSNIVSPPLIKTSYTQSLWDFLFQSTLRAGAPRGGRP